MKKYKIAADKLLPLVSGYGGCLCNDKITVDGLPILYMYREKPSNEMDSGWRFFSGTEDDQYMQDISKHAVYDVNTIANYDMDIIPFLDAPIGSEFERNSASDGFTSLNE